MDPTLAAQVRELLAEVSEFDANAVEQAPERVRDLLKRLYHGLFPREVRHDLGEYYTPDWLAERVLAQVDADLFGSLGGSAEKRHQQAGRVAPRLTTTRLLDPACGSGTFLVMIIRRLRQWARETGVLEREELLSALVKNVVGFDLNPLAVMSSRANFLLAVADLLKPGDEPIDLPVYLADSIVLPAEGQGESLWDTQRGVYALPLRGVGRSFVVPSKLADRVSLRILSDQLRKDVSKEESEEAFLRSCEARFGLPPQEWQRVRDTLSDLYGTLTALHKEGRNGLWADIARNMFMPLFEGGFDYVVGNPPWVNWQSLPQHYRERSRDLWERYGLFVHGGMDAILGKGKKELSALFLYVCCDRYLKPAGRLGFVITQGVFKTSAAGQGFRRFVLPDGQGMRVMAVDDFSAIQPFEEATNRTAVVVMQKGQLTTYPLRSYFLWRKKGRKSVPFSASLDEAIPLLTRRDVSAEPVDSADPTSAWLTAKPRALTGLRKVLGGSEYRAYAGAYSGGANAVYWLQMLGRNADGTVDVRNIAEGAKRRIDVEVHNIEPGLLHPLLRGREVRRWSAHGQSDAYFLIVQDPATRRGIGESDMAREYPRTLTYLRSFEEVLRARAALKRYFGPSDPFYSMFNIGAYTVAPHKVVWAEQGKFGCAVIGSADGQIMVPDHKIMLVPFDEEDEAYYVCAMMNSSPFAAAVTAYTLETQQDPHILDNVRVPKFDSRDRVHRDLADLSRRAHGIASGSELGVLADVEREVDECARQVWGLTSEEMLALQSSARDRNA